MKRHPLLIPLSQDHHHSLAMCARILRDPAALATAHLVQLAAEKQAIVEHRPDLPYHAVALIRSHRPANR